MTYDKSNLFAKILSGEIPCEKIYEDDDVLCFNDINPQATIHVLIIPKGEYVSFDDFVTKADTKTIEIFFKKIKLIADKLDLKNTGYRIVSNHGLNANQEIPHFHVHLLAGENLGGILKK